MKFLYIALIAISTISFSQLASAQQQINNDGASASELQPQSQNVQNNAGNQQDGVLNINNNVGNSDLLKNVKVNELNVTGAPSNSEIATTTKSLVSLLVLAFGMFLVLLLPAIAYGRKFGSNAKTATTTPTKNTDNIEPNISSDIVSDLSNDTKPTNNGAKDGSNTKAKAKKSSKSKKAKSSKKKSAKK